ncbi:biotin--[acetyl-CoA-carboxylase] ligase [Novosphingobium sp. B 225]|uniref:biotin--[acetyl-CoA-carboxylase] ligase n=1 Tax=Novosphingobium sp. B 225 TaxID=1961849 RepID=UPI000B4A834D|nr:biotin--[acetyl-CoA-carboxylase] ligase [Novosphingobium sp. B 225]
MIQYVAATGSTNADLAARAAAREALREGDWLVADRQSAGRGRQGRAWFDSSGNFMGSTWVERCAGDPMPGTLALVAGLAVFEAVTPLIPPPQRAMLKWPNDVLVGGAKLCGILLEGTGQGVVVGIGVNLARAPQVEGRETTALSAYGPAPDRDAFAAVLARQFELELERWRTFGLEPLVRRWTAAGHPEGTPLQVGEPGDEPLRGTFAGLASDGALQLRLTDGTTLAIHAGEVRLAADN